MKTRSIIMWGLIGCCSRWMGRPTAGLISERVSRTRSATLPYARDSIYDSGDFDPDVDYNVDRWTSKQPSLKAMVWVIGTMILVSTILRYHSINSMRDEFREGTDVSTRLALKLVVFSLLDRM